MANENESLGDSQNVESSATIEEQGEGAADSTAEDTLKSYEKLVEQLSAQNAELMKNQQSLQSQIGELIRNGATAGKPSADTESTTEPEEPYVPLAELGKELGKRDYKSHNSIRGDD